MHRRNQLSDADTPTALGRGLCPTTSADREHRGGVIQTQIAAGIAAVLRVNYC